MRCLVVPSFLDPLSQDVKCAALEIGSGGFGSGNPVCKAGADGIREGDWWFAKDGMDGGGRLGLVPEAADPSNLRTLPLSRPQLQTGQPQIWQKSFLGLWLMSSYWSCEWSVVVL